MFVKAYKKQLKTTREEVKFKPIVSPYIENANDLVSESQTSRGGQSTVRVLVSNQDEEEKEEHDFMSPTSGYEESMLASIQ